MKDIRSVLVMSSSEADPESCDEMTMGTNVLSSVGMLHNPIEQFTSSEHSSRMNFMDWTGYLIELTVSTEEVSAEESIFSCFTTPSSMETSESTSDEAHTDSTKTLASFTSITESNTQDTQHWLGADLEGVLTLANTGTSSISQENTSTSTGLSSQTIIDPPITSGRKFDICSTNDHISLWTNEDTICQNVSTSTSSVPRQQLVLDDFNLLDHQYSSTALENNSTIASRSSVSNTFIQRNVIKDNLTGDNNDDYTVDPLYFPSVHFGMDRQDSFEVNHMQPDATSLSHSALSFSLNTPVSEAFPGFKDTEVVNAASRVVDSTDYSSSYQTSSSGGANATPFSSQPADIFQYKFVTDGDSLPDNDIAAVEIVSWESDISSTCQSSCDNPSDQSSLPNYFHETTTECQHIEVPFSWASYNLQDIITSPNAGSSEQTPAYPPEILSQELYTDASLPPISSAEIINYTTNHLTSESDARAIESCSFQRDMSHLSELDTWSLDSNQPKIDPETFISHINSSRSNPSEDLVLDDLHEIRGYCLTKHSRKRHQLLECMSKISSSCSETENPLVGSVFTYSKKRIVHRESTKARTLSEETSCIVPSGHKAEHRVTSHLLPHQQQETNKHNQTLLNHNQRSQSCGLPIPQSPEQPDCGFIDTSMDSTHQLTSEAFSILLTDTHPRSSPFSQTPRHISHLNSPSELSSDALLSPGDAFKSIVVSKNASSTDTCQMEWVMSRIVSDTSDMSREDSNVSTIQSATSASCTGGEGSPEPVSTDTLKETLRSKLKAKRKTVAFPVNASSLEVSQNIKSSTSGLNKVSSKEYPSTSRGTSPSKAHYTYSATPGSNSSQNSRYKQNSASNISQSESSDDEDAEDNDKNETVSTPSSSKKRRPKYEEENDEDSEGTRLAKREKNRLAAQKCRRRKKDRIETLTQQVHRLEHKQDKIKTEVDKLEMEREHLQEMLRLHSFVCQKKSQGYGSK